MVSWSLNLALKRVVGFGSVWHVFRVGVYGLQNTHGTSIVGMGDDRASKRGFVHLSTSRTDSIWLPIGNRKVLDDERCQRGVRFEGVEGVGYIVVSNWQIPAPLDFLPDTFRLSLSHLLSVDAHSIECRQ